MRPIHPSRARATAALLTAIALTQLGASAPRKKKHVEPPPPKVAETVGDLAYIFNHSELKVEGVGLVVGLDGTGGDAPPSWGRSKLIDEMRKAGVEKADKLLSDSKTASRVSMVLVHLTIPVGVSPKDRLDVEIEVPPGCGTKSLAGGYLLLTRLKEVKLAGGAPKEGADLALAQGPVMIGTLTKPGDTKKGRILGGGRIKDERPFRIVIKDNRKSFKTSTILQAVVNQRFQQHDGIDQKGVANSKTDQMIELKVPPVYHQNQDRYFRVIKLLPMVDSPPLRAQRVEAWTKDLLDPKKAGIAALRLEGIGVTAADAIKTGLASPNAQVRFFAAEALAYLGDGAGADVLAETAAHQPEFRAYALAALAAMDQPVAHMKLRKLMDEPEIEVRYGAFNALRTLDERDPFLGRVRVLDAPPEEPEEYGESMTMAITRRRNRAKLDDPFELFLVDCEGPPLIHVARTRRCEVVVFGHNQRLLTPIVLGNGAILLNAADGDDAVQISKIVPSQFADSDAKVTATLELGDVLRQSANLGANYPEIVAILQAAEKQKNLPGPLVVDALPATSVVYSEAVLLGRDTTPKKDDAVKQTKAEKTEPPKRRGFFRRETPPKPDDKKDDKKDDAVVPAKAATAEEAPAPRRRSFLDPFGLFSRDR